LNTPPTLSVIVYVIHPRIRKDSIERRTFQEDIAASCKKRSTLVVLPTGLGKTVVALMVVADVLERKAGKILFLAPTKPLAEQHASFLKKYLNYEDAESVALFTGEVSPKKREAIWAENEIIVSTPQVVENDLISGRTNLKDVGLVIFDEAHRAAGNYAYVFVAERYHQDRADPLILGITASPGSTSEKILSVCKNLGIEGVEIRSELDVDVSPFVHDVRLQWIKVGLPENSKQLINLLQATLNEKVVRLQRFGLLKKGKYVSTKDLLDASKAIQGRMRRGKAGGSSALYFAATVQAAAIKVNHAIELAQTQGISALRAYLDRLMEEAASRGGSKASRTLVHEARMRRVIELSKKIEDEHPKLPMVLKVVRGQLKMKPDSKIIVFTHYRDTAELVSKELETCDMVRPVRFVGQSTRGEDKGLSQKEQVDLIQRFKDGEFNTLVATSVAEEGLDIPATDLVVLFEPVASEIRTIQRRGRTGRTRVGRVVVLIAKETRDEAYYWSARAKEKRMKSELWMLRRELSGKIDVGEFKKAENMDEEEKPPPGMNADTIEGELDVVAPETIEDDRIEIADRRPDPPSNGMSLPEESQIESKTTGTDLGMKRAPHRTKEIDAGLEGVSHQTTEIDPELEGVPHQTPEKDHGSERAPPQISYGKKQNGQANIFEFQDPKKDGLSIIVDTREFHSPVVKELARMDIKVNSQVLDVGDYVLSDRLCVERKEAEDFLRSLLDGRLFIQVKHLNEEYTRPVMIIEGEDLFERHRIQESAIMGALGSLLADFRIPIISTKDAQETARLIAAMLKGEYTEGRRPGIRGKKGPMSLRERQRFIVEGLPNVSAMLAKRLLDHFGI